VVGSDWKWVGRVGFVARVDRRGAGSVRPGGSGLDVGAGPLDGASDELLLPSMAAKGSVAAFDARPSRRQASEGQVLETAAPGAERELLAGSPLGASLNDRDNARSCCEPSRDLTPWSSGGFRPTVEPSDSGRFEVLEKRERPDVVATPGTG
jgi:hypothetical protein